jgi:KDO2-lipid IV(A) lauroyltransferase
MKLKVLLWLSRRTYAQLHGLSSVLAFLAHHVIKYRLKVIRGNLERSFPEKTKEWHRQIEKEYYAHFGDITVESVKHFSIDNELAMSRMKHVNVEVFSPFFETGRSVLIAGGHLNNWELYAVTANQNVPHDVMAVYKKLSDPVMDEAVRNSRQRFGLEMVRTVDAQSWMKKHATGSRPKAVVMGFDQSPANPKKAWWTPFLNQETAWYYGLEKWAHQYDLPVIYGHIYKDARGQYTTRYELVADHPAELKLGEVLNRCITLLEADIRNHPGHWLWSHKRWKHVRPENIPIQERHVASAKKIDHV